jgi:hypothetical protein
MSNYERQELSDEYHETSDKAANLCIQLVATVMACKESSYNKASILGANALGLIKTMVKTHESEEELMEFLPLFINEVIKSLSECLPEEKMHMVLDEAQSL